MKKSLFLLIALLTSCASMKSNKEELVCMQIIDRNGLNETISSKDRLDKYQKHDFLDSQPYKQVIRIYDNKETQKRSKITTYHPNGIIFQYLEVAKARAFGKYKQWHSNGQLAIEASVIGGPAGMSDIEQKQWIFNGPSKAWDENGNLLLIFNYEKGDLEGISYEYHTNGNIKKIEPYLKNEINGDVTEYNPQNEIMSKVSYKEGKKEGLAEGFWDSKTPYFTETYKKGLLLEGTYFNKNGDIISRIQNKTGLKTVFFEKNKILIEYKNGIPEGKIQVSKKNILFQTYHVKNNQNHGEEIEYYPDGTTPKISIDWSEDVIQGLVKTWYNNGNIQSQKEMHGNKKNGTNTVWYKNNSLMLIEEYENNLLVKGVYYQKNENIPSSTILKGNGIATLYDEDGNFLKTIKYSKSIPEVE
jgi:antitoxin component YwqK of YwqJK toxin-antitoxin module